MLIKEYFIDACESGHGAKDLLSPLQHSGLQNFESVYFFLSFSFYQPVPRPPQLLSPESIFITVFIYYCSKEELVLTVIAS